MQGIFNRIDKVIELIKKGNKKSRITEIKIEHIQININRVFIVRGWTSQTRNFNSPTDLVFQIRDDESIISKKQAKQIYKQIVEKVINRNRQ